MVKKRNVKIDNYDKINAHTLFSLHRGWGGDGVENS